MVPLEHLILFNINFCCHADLCCGTGPQMILKPSKKLFGIVSVAESLVLFPKMLQDSANALAFLIRLVMYLTFALEGVYTFQE